MNKEILLVVDEKDIRSSISVLLNDEDYNCRSVANSDDDVNDGWQPSFKKYLLKNRHTEYRLNDCYDLCYV